MPRLNHQLDRASLVQDEPGRRTCRTARNKFAAQAGVYLKLRPHLEAAWRFREADQAHIRRLELRPEAFAPYVRDVSVAGGERRPERVTLERIG